VGAAGPDGGPAAKAVYVAVRDAVADLGPHDLVLVACSGGPDSLALAAAAAKLAPRGGPSAGAVVVDHGWSATASAAAARAGVACRGLGLAPVDVVAVDTSGPGGPEAAARDARYAALEAAAARHGAGAVLLGHTRDDQAETVLLGLARGSGARSMAGMPSRRGPYRRPMLGLPRATPAAACAELGLAPWQDPANSDTAYARVRVRAAAEALAAALGPGFAENLARSADLLREDADALDTAAGDLLVVAGAAGVGGGAGDAGPDAGPGAGPGAGLDAGLDVGVLAGAPAAVRRRALLAAARAAGCRPGSLTRAHALALDGLVTGGRTRGTVRLPDGVVALLDCGRLRCAAPPSSGTDTGFGPASGPVSGPAKSSGPTPG
jgi:tRNA(Ile)-lysidine synthase